MKDMAHRQPHAHRVEVYAPRYELLLFVAGLFAVLLLLALASPVRP